MKFKKAAFFTDIHFGGRSNSEQHNIDCIEFVDWFIVNAKKHNCETCFFLGDFHNNRSTINLQTLQYCMKAIEKLSNAFDNVYMLAGNHDTFHRNRRDVISMEWGKHIPNVHIINDWFITEHVVIAPWLLEDDHLRLQNMKGKYLLGHFELPRFYMNSMVQMPEHNGIKLEDVTGFEWVFSGHFHKRQIRNNVCYIGNAFPHNYSDVNDDERGMMVLEWDGVPEFYSWPNQPIYRQYNLSQLIDDTSLLKPNANIKLNIDMDISYEEANLIKESLVADFKVRELKLIQNKQIAIDETVSDIENEPVEKIIIDQIANIKSEFYKSNLLMEIYTKL